MEQAQEQLAQRRKEVEADLARAQLARLQDALKSLHERQQQALAETGRLEDLRSAAGELSRAQSSSVHSLTREQKALEAETRSQGEKLAAAEVFQLALASAARDMARAVASLERGETGAATQQAEQDALARLAALLEALKPSNQAGPPKKSGGDGGQGKQGGNTRCDQAALRTEALETDARGPQPQVPATAECRGRCGARQRQTELGEEQGRLAEVAFKLSKPLEGNPEDDPDKLPDLRTPKNDDPEAPGEPQSLDDKLLPADGDE